MDPNLLSQIASGVGMAGGLWAIVRWQQDRQQKNEGGSPGEPRPLNDVPDWVLSRDIAFKGLMDNHAANMQRLTEAVTDLVKQEAREPQPNPEWIADLERRLAVTQGMDRSKLDTLIDRLETLIQLGPPVVEVDADLGELPKKLAAAVDELAGLPSQVAQKQDESSRRMLVAAKSGQSITPPRPSLTPPSGPRLVPGPLPPIPSIPPSYVGGTVFVTGGSPQNLLLLIQQQLAPNCPGTCVQFRLAADSEMFVGAASFLGGPLTNQNYAYVLEAGEKRIYQSAYPGSSTPIGDLQVLGSGALHVEVQL